MNSPKSVAVLLGPSLGLEEARMHLDADYLPPARKGDIYRIMATGVKIIVLIDGVFHNTPSIWPREILSALEEGIQVIGAASMGALRAAELHRFGMVGYGTVFEWYRSGLIDGDDEVAVSHAEEEFGFRPLSEALVNIRYTLNRAVMDGVLSEERACQLLNYAKELYYPERSYDRLLSAYLPERERSVLRSYFAARGVNLKMMDAIGVLRHVSETQHSRLRSGNTNARRSHEDLWQLDRLRLGGFVAGEAILTGEALLEEARKDPELIASMRRTLSERCFLLEWAAQNQISVPDAFVEDYVERWKDSNGIDEEDIWMRANGLTREFSRKLLAERALADWMTNEEPASRFILEWAALNGISCASADWITSKGPNHFGLLWAFEDALIREMQITGKAAQLLRNRQRS